MFSCISPPAYPLSPSQALGEVEREEDTEEKESNSYMDLLLLYLVFSLV
jgi:hypothetical protein